MRIDLGPIREWLRRVGWPWDALLVLLAAGILVSLIFGWSEAAGLFAGTLFAAALILRFPPAVAGVAPLGGFLLGLRPLLLPILIVLVAGTVAYSWPVPLLVVPALLVAGWYALVAPELGPARQAFSSTRRWLGGGFQGRAPVLVAVLIVVGVLTIVYVVIDLTPTAGLYLHRPEISNAAITVALAAWMVAAIFRLGGFATSWFRAVVALLSVLTLVRMLMAAGLLPGHDWLAGHAGWLSTTNLAIATAIGLGAIVLADATISLIPRLRFLESWGAFPTTLGGTLRGIGFGAALFATVALGLAAFYGVISSQANGHAGVTPSDQVITGKIVSPKVTGLPVVALDYQPVLVMTDTERWAPMAVDRYLRDPRYPTYMTRPQGPRKLAPSLARLPQRCHAGIPAPCFHLTIDCPSGSDPCAEGQSYRHDLGDTVPDYRDGADYVRIISHRKPGGSPQAFLDPVGPYGTQVKALIQYWYFYRYDEWMRPVLGGRLVQRHEGDWEAVTIGFSQKAPLFLALSAHCGGSWVPWQRAEIAPTTTGRRVHPLVAVAEGSHANYTNAQDRRAPDWAGCKGVPQGSTTALSYASNIRDETSNGWEWMPARTIYVNNRTPPMSFPGSWGGNDYTVLENERTQVLSGPGGGPLTPSLQPLWYDPMRTIFCSAHWHGPGGCRP